jgi:hypothetical protein
VLECCISPYRLYYWTSLPHDLPVPIASLLPDHFELEIHVLQSRAAIKFLK